MARDMAEYWKGSEMKDWKTRAQRNHERFSASGNVSRDPNGPEQARFLALALCGEAGELANLIKKAWRGDRIDILDIADELADVRVYLEHLARVLGVDLDEACERKVDEVENRLNAKERLKEGTP